MTGVAAAAPSVSRFETRGQSVAVDAVRRMLGAQAPHALLLVGPGGVGKTTLALDLAAGLLCVGAGGSERPCRTCRGCRMVVSGNHPDLHRLAPSGPGGQIRIGRRDDAEPGTVRRLTADLALLPVEGGARVAIVEQADRMNEDAQSALLKTLEEPPFGVTIVLCAADEERLLDTVRSRCTRLRLGPVPPRDIEELLADRAAVEAPVAARLGRLSGGLPGIAMAYAAAPGSVTVRSEIARSLLDLLGEGRARRLEALTSIVAAAGEHARELDAARAGDASSGVPTAGRSARRGGRATPTAAAENSDGEAAAARAPATERRRAAASLLEIWRDVARDLAVHAVGRPELVRDLAILDELGAAREGIDAAGFAHFLRGLDRAGELIEANVSPELVLDALVLAWPRRST